MKETEEQNTEEINAEEQKQLEDLDVINQALEIALRKRNSTFDS